MSRTVRLQLCSRTGTPLGTLPPFTVHTPWWPDVEPVVRTARARFGVDIFVLRLLSAETPSDVMGGAVRYLAELIWPPPRAARTTTPDDHPLRAHWARPGGIATIVEWADTTLAAAGRPRNGPAVQVKTWNLSSILRLPTTDGDVWCKSVPPFFAHEPTVMAIVAEEDPSLVPPVLATDYAGSTLIADVPGKDQWGALAPRLIEMVRRLVALQARSRIGDLLAAGVPDWRAPALTSKVDAVLRRARLPEDELTALRALAADLPRRFARLAACGLPETLVHGDFHPGNWRLGAGGLVLLDWGDSGVGHPLLDLAAFLSRIPGTVRDQIRSAWLDAWREHRPDSDPVRAARLVAPIAALRQAIIYQCFLDGIEPSEHRYHEADVPQWLRRALRAASA
jgi:hypothetical protein